MEMKTTGGNAFAHLEVSLNQGESVQAESGAMLSMTGNLSLESTMKGGVMGGLARKFLTGETFFFQKIEANDSDGVVNLAPAFPGDIAVLELDESKSYRLQKDAFLAAEETVHLETKMQNLAKGLFSGEGFFIITVSGTGKLAVSSYGSIIKRTLADSEELVVDNGHLVAWSSETDYKVEKASKGWISSFTSGEGLVCRFTGPGDVYIQSRNAQGFGQWVVSLLPTKKEKSD